MGEETGLVEVGVRGEGLEFLVEDVFLPLLGRKRRPMGPRRVSRLIGRFRRDC